MRPTLLLLALLAFFPELAADDSARRYLGKADAWFASAEAKKVAEARARKSKMAKVKLAAAKKKAEAVANSSEMSEAMKLKAISKAMRGKDASRPGKTYVVSKKGGGSKGGKGLHDGSWRVCNNKSMSTRNEPRWSMVQSAAKYACNFLNTTLLMKRSACFWDPMTV